MSKPLLLVLMLAALACTGRSEHADTASAVQSPPASQAPERSSSTAQAVTVGAFNLSLTGCTLTAEGASTRARVAFEFPEPCQFSRDRTGAVRVVETGATKTLLVEASRPAEPTTGATSRDCVTQVRGIVISAKEIRLSVQTQTVAQCLPAVWDDTMFHAFAARTEAIPKDR